MSQVSPVSFGSETDMAPSDSPWEYLKSSIAVCENILDVVKMLGSWKSWMRDELEKLPERSKGAGDGRPKDVDQGLM